MSNKKKQKTESAVAPATAPRPAMSRGTLAYLMLTAVLCGGLVMVIEVMGSRVIGPFFGVSLYVWTSLISVTMIALAAGYALGGQLADRRGTADYLYLIIGLAGVVTLLVPLLKGPVLRLCFPLGLRMGAFVSSLLLFGPVLFLLGCVSPYLVKISTRELTRIGRTVGGFYALSTVGSVLGTVLTGFVLIAHLGVARIFGLAGSILIGLAVVYLVGFRRNWKALAAVILPLLLFPGGDRPGLSRTLESGTQATLINTTDSYYGTLKVIDYTYGQAHTREMIIDGLVQGGIDMRTQQSVYAYSYYLERIPRMLNPDGTSCLVVGLGAGLIPRGYEAQGVRTDVVDIDPAVVELARKYFGFRGTGEVVTEDARYYLATADRRWDYVVLDVFNGDTTPGYLLSREAVELLHAAVADGGVLAVNLVGSLRGETYMTASVLRTLRTAFDQVEIFPTFDPAQSPGGNMAVMAYDGPRRSIDVAALRAQPMHMLAAKQVRAIIGMKFEFPEDTPSMILTDDYNPIDHHDSGIRESVREDILKTTPWDLLIESS